MGRGLGGGYLRTLLFWLSPARLVPAELDILEDCKLRAACRAPAALVGHVVQPRRASSVAAERRTRLPHLSQETQADLRVALCRGRAAVAPVAMRLGSAA